MINPKRAAPFLSIAAFVLTLHYLRSQESARLWQRVTPIPGDGSMILEEDPIISDTSNVGKSRLQAWDVSPVFVPGTPYPPGSNYTRALVMPRTAAEDVSWIETEKLYIIPAIYVVDDPKASLRPPKNKGHEVMVYLTYIIDQYNQLPDINIFMHAHRWSWHNNELLNNDSAEMIRRLSSERVIREGYMNMRCHWEPGCPDWMHPGVVGLDINKQEENLMVQCWAELFPGQAVPTSLAQPCCAQFAISRDRIRSIPLAKYVFYREWLLRTELQDQISGRIWEYIWQYVFTGESYVCPNQHQCYCDGYGLCFEDEREFDKWVELKLQKTAAEDQLKLWVQQVEAIERFKREGKADASNLLEEPPAGKDLELQIWISVLNGEMEDKRAAAVVRGTDARVRAEIAGREWREGDGF